jgi:hypothetical protein
MYLFILIEEAMKWEEEEEKKRENDKWNSFLMSSYEWNSTG